MIKLIACDIDGTLLQGGQTQIHPEVLAQAVRLMDRGVRFCPASGRQYTSLRRLFAPIADRMYSICENGAAIFGPGGALLQTVPMDRKLALAVCREILAAEQCEVLISGANTSYLCPKQADIVAHVRDFVGNNVAVLNAPADTPEEILKVSAYCRQGAGPMEPVLAPKWQGIFQTAIAGEKWLDFTLADKGTGITRLCALLGIAPGEVMAFGDNYNDLPMLELVGYPYMMENAVPELRQRFPLHCFAVEEVLARLYDDPVPPTEA